MKWKLANPLEYPLAVLAGGVLLIIGGRFAEVPPALMVPLSLAFATGGAIVLKSREPERLKLGDPLLEREIMQIKQSALALVKRAEALRQEASNLLINADQMDLLISVQYACDRVVELPYKIDEIALRLGKNESLLSIAELEQQIQQLALKRQSVTSAAGRARLDRLLDTLRQNLELAREGQDSRQIQLASLIQMVTESGGLLQQMQNKIRTIGTNSAIAIDELQELSNQLNSYQENVTMILTDRG